VQNKSTKNELQARAKNQNNNSGRSIMKSTVSNNANKKLSPVQREELLGALKTRFEKNMIRHEGCVDGSTGAAGSQS